VSDAARRFDPSAITRPDERLMKYYVIVALLSLVAFPVTLFVLWVKYRTLRYRFDDEGVWRAQGLLWRSEVNVTYRRIQDIHLTNGLLQRWMGLSTVSIQTAAGSASPEVTIEGVLEAEALRDFLYTKMRGVRDAGHAARPTPAPAAASGATAAAGSDDEALALLVDIRDALRRLESRAPRAPGGAA
jgi:putative membrane protein